MDPITGLAALVGISLASIAGLRLKKIREEGFVSLPNESTVGKTEEEIKRDVNYRDSVEESQSRYNMFSGLVNPITNSIIPVGSSGAVIAKTKDTVKAALGSYDAVFSPDSSQTLVLKSFENQFKPRSDSQKSLYGAMKFCRDAGKQQSPFSIYDTDGNVKVQGAVSPDGWKFDEICGVCLTSGVDEEGNRFRTTQGMVVDSSQRDAAYDEAKQNGWSYPRIGPSIGVCEGAPNTPVFATNAKDLQRYKARHACVEAKSIGGAENCALCYDSEGVFSSITPDTQTNPVYFTLQGTGTVTLKIKGVSVGKKILSESSPVTMELTNAKEGDTFILEVIGSETTETTNIYGYLHSKNPNDGIFAMPLNLVAVTDDQTGSSPSKSGGFYTFPDLGLDVAKIRPSPGKTSMSLRGTLPFTFVQPSEFAAMDCIANPYQTRMSSATAFATDQPCFSKGTGPGKYNDACLRQRILDAGCTNAGSLYKNPSSLNTKDGALQNLSKIYSALQTIVGNDMVDPAATLQCSGRTIQTPCDPFVLNPTTKKFKASLQSTNKTVSQQAQQCLSFLYNNKGASETVNPPRVGPTYDGMVTYKNNQKDVKNIYCLPEGALNPDVNASARDNLARIGDSGYKGKIGVDAIKQYLNDQLSLAVDMTKNANTDPDRKVAIINCFGKDLNSLPSPVTGKPTVISNPCGVVAQYVRVLPSPKVADSFIEISQIAVIDKNGKNVAPGKSTAGTTGPFPTGSFGSHSISNAIDGQLYIKSQNFYASQTAGGTTQFLLNLGQPTDITKIIYITRGDSNRTSHYRKDGIRLQLLDANQKVVDQKILNSSLREDISYLLAGADSSCKSDLPSTSPVTFPPGFTPGVYLRFYNITDSQPDVTPGNRGWGERTGTPGAYAVIKFTEKNLAKINNCGFVAKGYYVAPGPETLYLYTESDDGIYVSFNNRQVINNWSLRTSGAKADSSAPITIQAAGVYPFEVRFYQWGGSATCNLFFRINNEATWKSDLSSRFAFKTSEIQQEDAEYQAKILAKQQAAAAAARLVSSQPPTKKAVLFGPYVNFGKEMVSEVTFTLPTGEKVYGVFDTGASKFVTERGLSKYYWGPLNLFRPNAWNTYIDNGNAYRLKFV